VAVDGNGNVYVADSGNNRIEVFGSLPVPTKSTSWGRIKTLYR
jgi:DNA-binding beta-propeller fold protein YncE